MEWNVVHDNIQQDIALLSPIGPDKLILGVKLK